MRRCFWTPIACNSTGFSAITSDWLWYKWNQHQPRSLIQAASTRSQHTFRMWTHPEFIWFLKKLLQLISSVLYPGSSHFYPLCCFHALEVYAKYVTGHFIVFPVALPTLMAEIGVWFLLTLQWFYCCILEVSVLVYFAPFRVVCLKHC